MRYRLTVAYDGTDYSGWQTQPRLSTIQQTLQDAIQQLTGESLTVVGSGRTDAGVHAKAQVAHFDSERSLDCRRFQLSLNGILPPDIRILELYPTSVDFHARFSARSKIYHYHLWLDPVLDPFLRRYRLQVYTPLDLRLFRMAADQLVGTHDFRSLANVRGPNLEPKTTVRTLRRVDIIPEEGGLRVEFEADGFLYKMVRNIVGLLLEVGAGKRPLEELQQILSAKDRREAGKAAPSRGLFLMRVDY